MRSVWIHGKEHKKALGHRDRELATRQAYEFMHDLVTDEDVESGVLTLGMLELALIVAEGAGRRISAWQEPPLG